MRWVLIDGHIHAAPQAGGGKTFCGKSLGRATMIVHAPRGARCSHCDRQWRAAGRREKTPARSDKRAVYTPRYKFHDWEREGAPPFEDFLDEACDRLFPEG